MTRHIFVTNTLCMVLEFLFLCRSANKDGRLLFNVFLFFSVMNIR